MEQHVGVSCVSGGPVFCRVSLDRGGYVPGESIGISATVSNRSKSTMKSTKASLTETIQYLCRGKVLASETRELASVSRGKIRPGESEEWLNEQLYVPPLPPTNLRGCHLINVLYHVYVSFQILQFCVLVEYVAATSWQIRLFMKFFLFFASYSKTVYFSLIKTNFWIYISWDQLQPDLLRS